MFDPERFISARARDVDASGIRRVFDLASEMADPINLSIGQPDFDVPDPIKHAAIEAIRQGRNRYTPTQGESALRQRLLADLCDEFPNWGVGDCEDSDVAVLVTSGVSGGLVLALLACVGPGDEVLIPDPYFVMYRHLVRLVGAEPVYVDTYPDFRLTAKLVEPHLNQRSKMILFNSPSNPTGVVSRDQECQQLVDLANQHGLLLVSDEIYNEFCYEKERCPLGRTGPPRYPSPAAYTRDLLVLRGFSKTYAMTGWRLGYAAGPRPIIEQMAKLQQFTFVCAPSMAQAAALAALDEDMGTHVEAYRRKRDQVVERLSPHYELANPGGAFYVFPKLPSHLAMTGTQFVERAIAKGLLIIPGAVFSRRDTHFRLSYACDDATLDRGLDLLAEMSRGA